MKRLLLILVLFSSVAYADSRTVPADIFQVNVTGNHVNLDAPSVSSSYSYHLPAAQATGASCLVNDGSGNASWLTYGSGNTASTLVERDSSGNFSAGTITAALSGNATNVTGTVATGNGGTNKATWTAGSIPYLSGSTQFAEDNTNLFWDGTNHRLGIGTTAPASVLQVETTTNRNLRVEDNGGGVVTLRSLTDASLAAAMGIQADTLRINSTTGGFVGIGVNTPGSLLDVAGKFQVDSNGDPVLMRNVAYTWPALQGGASTILSNDGAGNLSWAAAGGSGTVTSVALTVPSFLSETGSPVTTAGTLAISLSGTALPLANGGTGDTSFTTNAVVVGGASQLAVVTNNATATNKFLTQSSSAAPAWSILVSGDIPNNGANTTGTAANVTGTVATGNGGTNKTSWTTGSIPYLSGATQMGEDNANLFWDGTNHRLGIGTTAPGARLEVRNGHFRSTQTTAPVATVNANAGTGATCTVAHATDTAGAITLVLGSSGNSIGDQCDVAFNSAYGTAPICSISPANQTAGDSTLIDPYATTSTAAFSLQAAANTGSTATLVFAYTCIETQ